MRTPPSYQRDLLSPLIPPRFEISFDLRCFQVLSDAQNARGILAHRIAIGQFAVVRGCPAMLCTTGRLEAPKPSSSRTHGFLLSGGNTPRRYYNANSSGAAILAACPRGQGLPGGRSDAGWRLRLPRRAAAFPEVRIVSQTSRAGYMRCCLAVSSYPLSEPCQKAAFDST